MGLCVLCPSGSDSVGRDQQGAMFSHQTVVHMQHGDKSRTEELRITGSAQSHGSNANIVPIQHIFMSFFAAGLDELFSAGGMWLSRACTS